MAEKLDNWNSGSLPVDPPEGWGGSAEDYYRFSGAVARAIEVLNEAGIGYILSLLSKEGDIGVTSVGGITKLEAETMIAVTIATGKMNILNILSAISSDPDSGLIMNVMPIGHDSGDGIN